MTPEEAMQDALQKYHDCKHAEWKNGLDCFLRLTIVVQLWRNYECYINDDPPRRVVQGYRR